VGIAGRHLVATCFVCTFVLGFCPPAGATVTRSGILHELVADNFRTGQSNTRYTVGSGNGKTVVVPTELAADPGDQVTVTGSVQGGRLVGSVEATSGSDAQASALTAGPRKTAVLLVTFPGEPEAPWSAEETRSKVFTAANSASAFYEEESYGEISLTGKLRSDGDVFGWLKLNTPTAGCPFTTWKDVADAAATAEGIDLSGYQHVIYVFPSQSSCSWLGIAPVGGDWLMINGNLGIHPIAHELGHDFGLEHAGSMTCTSGGVRVQISETCTTSDYGDPFDVMGNIAPRHSSGWNLAKLGILAPENIETVEASGVYSLRSALHRTTEPTVLRIRRVGFLSWYYLEVRASGGVFENVTDATTTGVSIRATAETFSPETLLLDANPGTATFNDAPLGVGETFDDGLVQIETLSAEGGSATVSVQLDEEPPTVPGGLTATTEPDGVQLRWDASTDNVGVDHYVIFRDGALIDTSTGAGFFDSVVPAGDHTYVVYAQDKSGNRSDASEPATATVPGVSGPNCSTGSCEVIYRYTGSTASWTVPPGVGSADFTVEGARGGGTGANFGARVAATLGSLTTGEPVTLSVGGMGKLYSEGGMGGFRGGGDGTFGAGGGGFSSVELGSTLMLLAGGGGGRGVNGTGQEKGASGGQGGELGTPGSGGAVTEAHGARLGGGQGGIPGGGDAAEENAGKGGGGGAVSGTTTCAGGAFVGDPGADGSSLNGGGGAPNGGGGGGGGYIGGGQGGGGAGDACDDKAGRGGGGGGSSFAAPGLSAEFTGGARGGDGMVSISYADPVAAIAHSYTTLLGQELVVPASSGVLAGASGPGGTFLSASVVSPPVHGSLTLEDDGSFVYQPSAGFAGGDSFVYRAAASSGDYATARVGLRVTTSPLASISLPTAGGTYVLGQSVSTAFSCSEGPGGPGLASCNDSSGADTVSGGAGHLDTSTLGLHLYMVTAVSKDGLTDETSIDYTVVPASPTQSPHDPENSPGPEAPRRAVKLSLGVERESLSELLRTGKLIVKARVNGAATVALTGSATVEHRARRNARTRSVAVFRKETVHFVAPGEKRVTLVLSSQGLDVLRRLPASMLSIVGKATDAAGGTMARKVALAF
jgi:Bacterial Ig domain/Gametolysin peptidase M11